jgi:uncharacterized protein (DUF305 family)
VTVTQSASTDPASDPSVQPDRIDELQRRVRRLQVVVVSLVLTLLLTAVGVGASQWLRSRTPAQTSAEVGFTRDMYVHHGQAVLMALLLRNTSPEPFNTLTEDIITGQAEQQGMMLAWLSDHHMQAADGSWQPMVWMQGTPGMKKMAGHGGSMVTPTAATSAAPTPSPAAGTSSSSGLPLMPGMANDAELTALAQLRGRPREVLFLRLMLRHHQAGTDMARTYLELGHDPQLRELARSIVTSQDREISIMNDLLAERGVGAGNS